LIKFIQAIKLISLINDEELKKSEAAVLLEGDGYNRISQTVKLFKEKWAKWVIVSGGYNNPPFSIPAKNLSKALVKKGIPIQKIILEEKSQNTHEQAVEIMKLTKKRKWKKIILVASTFHQPRAYLTFIKVMEQLNMKIKIFNSPAQGLSWFKKTALNLNRLQLLEIELKKIEKYLKTGQIVSFKKALNYHQWKVTQNESR